MGHNVYENQKASGIGLGIFIALIDQLSKHGIVLLIEPGQILPVYPWLNFELFYNTGAAFSFLAQTDGGWSLSVLTGFNLIFSLVVIWQLATGRVQPGLARTALSLMLGGALGNLYDRFFYGKVTDFIDFHVGDWHFATFNLADSALCIGAALWLLANWRKPT